jgi:hypothetical protein
MCARTCSGDLRLASTCKPETPRPNHTGTNDDQVPSGPTRHPQKSGPSRSPAKSKAGSHNHMGTQSPGASPRKPAPLQRKGSVWDSFFQYDITYQGGKAMK